MTPISMGALRFAWVVSAVAFLAMLIAHQWIVAVALVLVTTAATLWQLSHRSTPLEPDEPLDFDE